jgi:DNA-binding XRE family transcriptional regulator
MRGSKRRPRPKKLAGKLLGIRLRLGLTQAEMAKRRAPKKLAKKLRQIRMKARLSQTEIVKVLKYSGPLRASQISQFENGKREPDLMLLLAYARIAGVTVDVLIDDKLHLK